MNVSEIVPLDQVVVSFAHPDQGQIVWQYVLSRNQDLLSVCTTDLVDVEAAPTDGLHRGLLVFETANLQCEVQD